MNLLLQKLYEFAEAIHSFQWTQLCKLFDCKCVEKKVANELQLFQLQIVLLTIQSKNKTFLGIITLFEQLFAQRLVFKWIKRRKMRKESSALRQIRPNQRHTLRLFSVHVWEIRASWFASFFLDWYITRTFMIAGSYKPTCEYIRHFDLVLLTMEIQHIEY